MINGSAASGRFFLIGPLRTGTSLLASCIDDHPAVVCLCESEINRALFDDYAVSLYCDRMIAHGLSVSEALRLLDRRKQGSIDCLMGWYEAVRPVVAHLYGKPVNAMLGDKSPDFAQNQELVCHLAHHYPLIYTTRDPRAIFASIQAQDESSPEEKADRWANLTRNYLAWKPHLAASNVLIIRYENLIRMPRLTMKRVYHHLGLPDSSRFLLPFPRSYPSRFLWETAVDPATGIRRDFEPRRIWSWQSKLTDAMLQELQADATVVEFMNRFGYH